MTEEEARNCLRITTYNHFEGRRSVVHEAAEAGSPELLRYLVCRWGVDVNLQTTSRKTALYYAMSIGHAECVRLLLELGADMNIVDDYGRTLRQTATMCGRRKILKILTSAGN